MVTPSSFSACDRPTCSGDEAKCHRAGVGVLDRDPSLPARANPTSGRKATYSWENPAEKQMRDFGVDFRPPCCEASWSWVMDNSQFGSDGQWLPDGKNLHNERRALLLEYLPSARSIDTVANITRQLALRGLAGAQSIQKALVSHGDQSKHNLLVTEKGRVVWVDFDRAEVLNRMTEDSLVAFKRDLIEVYNMLFTGR